MSVDQPKLFATRKVGPRGGQRLTGKEKLEDGLVMLREAHATLPRVVTEYYFARQIGRAWRFDFAYPDFKVAVEYEGATYGRQIVDFDGTPHRVVQSRHTDPVGFAEDCVKYNTAACLGWIVLRTNDHLVRERTIYDHVIAALKARGWKEQA